MKVTGLLFRFNIALMEKLEAAHSIVDSAFSSMLPRHAFDRSYFKRSNVAATSSDRGNGVTRINDRIFSERFGSHFCIIGKRDNCTLKFSTIFRCEQVKQQLQSLWASLIHCVTHTAQVRWLSVTETIDVLSLKARWKFFATFEEGTKIFIVLLLTTVTCSDVIQINKSSFQLVVRN